MISFLQTGLRSILPPLIGGGVALVCLEWREYGIKVNFNSVGHFITPPGRYIHNEQEDRYKKEDDEDVDQSKPNGYYGKCRYYSSHRANITRFRNRSSNGLLR